MNTEGIFTYAHNQHSVNIEYTHICIHACYLFTYELRRYVFYV